MHNVMYIRTCICSCMYNVHVSWSLIFTWNTISGPSKKNRSAESKLLQCVLHVHTQLHTEREGGRERERDREREREREGGREGGRERALTHDSGYEGDGKL